MAAKSLTEGDRRWFTEGSSCCIYVRSPISSSATIQKLEKVHVSVTQEQELWVYRDGQIPRPYLPTNLALTVNSGLIKSPIIQKQDREAIKERHGEGKFDCSAGGQKDRFYPHLRRGGHTYTQTLTLT